MKKTRTKITATPLDCWASRDGGGGNRTRHRISSEGGRDQRLGVGLGRVVDREAARLFGDEHADLGTAEDHGLGASAGETGNGILIRSMRERPRQHCGD
jgi:hypothetical protein